MRRPPSFVVATAILMIAVSTAAPQTAPEQNVPVPPVFTGTLSFGPAGALISPKAHAPFSARVVEQSQQTLSDGTNINRDSQEVVMRDGMGRIYRARLVKQPGGEESSPVFNITDPIKHVRYFCTVRRTCIQSEYRQPPARRPRPELHNSRDITVEDLGTSNISGVDVEGKRVTRIIPEGMIGNDRPLTSIQEVWHSAALDVDVQVKRVDPRAGTRTMLMTEVSVGEPDAKYFQVPEGYKVEERKLATGTLTPAPAEAEP